MNKNKLKIFEKIESELLSTLFSYVVPFLEKKIRTAPSKDKNSGNLENIVSSRPKISFGDVKELEMVLLKSMNENVKANKANKSDSENIFYSLDLTREKTKNEKANNYSISIKYEENESEDRLKIKIKQSEKEIYFAEIINKKEAKDKAAPYSVIITYTDNYTEERLSITYRQQLESYLKQHINSKEDMSERVPLKWVNILPETQMGGVLGFTYLGDHSMGRRADLTGKTARMVDIHESIHTPDEYETRCLTRWIMSKEKPKYKK
ncbi:hypothetical protein HYS31_05885 [Candidatus Woesearchaeota archaeon]|nr:hypothetical protein [Candidatus Woesearchaeota archaeon]